jgi:hypothetical protein
VTKPIGTQPRTTILAFPLGTTHTDKYGEIEVDHADLIMVEHNFQRHGNKLAWDVEHASHNNGPAEFQESHGWSDLRVTQAGVELPTEWNANGEQRLREKKFVYDSPEIRKWRGNHLFAIEGMSLVKDPARNKSTPLLMTNAQPAAADATTAAPPNNRTKLATQLHGDLGRLLDTMNAAQNEPELRPLVQKFAAGITDPTKELNQLLQVTGAATEKQPEKPTSEAAPEKPASPQPPADKPQTMSNRPDPLAEFGAEIMKQFGAKTIDEARGALAALKGDRAQLMSARSENAQLLLLSAVHEGKASPDELAQYKDETPEFVRGLLSNRTARVTTQSTASRQSADTQHNTAMPELDAMLRRTMGA